MFLIATTLFALQGAPNQASQPSTLRWCDFDRDGLRDVLVLGDLRGDRLLRNRGDGSFDDVTSFAGLDAGRRSTCAEWIDVNGDGYEDLVLGGDSLQLFQNGAGGLVEVAMPRGTDEFGAYVTRIEAIDFDADGRPDLQLETAAGARLLHNTGDNGFAPVRLLSEPELLHGAARVPEARGTVSPTAGSPESTSNSTGPGGGGAAAPGTQASRGPEIDDPTGSAGDARSTSLGSATRFGGSTVAASGPASCADAILDQATSSCVQASSVPTLGSLYPLSTELNVDLLTGYVGVNTTLPTARLHAVGGSGDLQTIRATNSETAGTAITAVRTAGLGEEPTVLATNNSAENFRSTILADDLNGTGIGYAMRARSNASIGFGLFADAFHTTGNTRGVEARARSPIGVGVRGLNIATTGDAVAVDGISSSLDGIGVRGSSPSTGVEGTGATGVHGMGGIGVLGESDEFNGIGLAGVVDTGAGVAGTANSSIGFFLQNSGVSGINFSTDGHGVAGVTTAGSGETFGVMGESASTTGGAGVLGEGYFGAWGVGTSVGVLGQSTTVSTGIGVLGAAASNTGTGVSGAANSSVGMFMPNTGVSGFNSTTDGYGVVGGNLSTSGLSIGVAGFSSSATGVAVRGDILSPTINAFANFATAVQGRQGGLGSTNGFGSGLWGSSESTAGTGVVGVSVDLSSTHGAEYLVQGRTGVSGSSNFTNGIGVSGIQFESLFGGNGTGVLGSVLGTTGSGIGVHGKVGSSQATGVLGENTNSSGLSDGVRAIGDLAATGTKFFVHPHPTDPSKEIRFVSLEGNESGTYFRGSARLEAGQCVIDVPAEFQMVTEPEGLTVQVTPNGPAQLWIQSKGLDRIVVRGAPDVEFDYFVNGVRHGYGSFDAVRRNVCYVPREKGVPFGAQYPEAVRQRLVDTGIVNADLTPNEATAGVLGWRLRSARRMESHSSALQSTPKQMEPVRLEQAGKKAAAPIGREVQRAVPSRTYQMRK